MIFYFLYLILISYYDYIHYFEDSYIKKKKILIAPGIGLTTERLPRLPNSKVFFLLMLTDVRLSSVYKCSNSYGYHKT